MIKLACESQVEEVSGQQTGLDPESVHPVAQSWIAPKLCPISWLYPASVNLGKEESWGLTQRRPTHSL
jgi:hypothetical protein